MAGKARVHELAKEFGVTSKEVLAKLAANGEWVKSASSTVEAGVAHRLREAYGFPHPATKAAGGKDHRRAPGAIPTPLDVAAGKPQRTVAATSYGSPRPTIKAADTEDQRQASGAFPTARDVAAGKPPRASTVTVASSKPELAGGKRQTSRLTSADALAVYRSYRLAATSANPNQASNDLLRECEARYGISRSALRGIVTSDKLRRLAAGEVRSASATDGVESTHRDATPEARLPEPQPTVAAQQNSGKAGVKSRYVPIRYEDELDIARQYQAAEASEDPRKAITDLLGLYEARYGLSEARLRRIAARHKGRLQAQRSRDDNELSARDQGNLKTARSSVHAGATQSALDGDATATDRPRDRVSGLPRLEVSLDLEGAADIVAGRRGLHDDRAAVFTCLQQLVPSESGQYNYLSWRYAAIRPTHSEPRLTSAHQDVMALAVVIDQERQLLDTLVRAHGSILTRPGLAERGLELEFRRLTGMAQGKRSPDDELRHTRAAIDLLRRAVVFSVAGAGNGQRLWDMLGQLRPTINEHIEASLRLAGAMQRLTDLIGTVERLLITDEANLAQFFLDSRAILAALHLGRYDFLRPLRDSAVGLRALAHHATPDLAFQVLPQGEQLRKFLGEVRASKRYSGYRVDEHRLTVLEDLQRHFGAHRCVWHRGSDSADGIGIRYLVLAIKSDNGSDENAVAVSPLAGRHATYVVRRDCAEADWKTLFAHPKFEARLLGARKLLFTDSRRHPDQYSAMRDKVIKLLECQPCEFR